MKKYIDKIKKTVVIMMALIISIAMIGLKIDLSHAEESEITWGLHNAKITEAQQLAENSTTICVGVMDSGIAADHPALDGKIYYDTTNYLHKDYTYDEKNGAYLLSPEDKSGHGTRVAGIIAANEQENGFTGVAQNIELISINVLGAAVNENEKLINAIDYATQKDIPILNYSGGAYSDYFIEDELSRLQDNVERYLNNGGLMIVAAGNAINDDPARDIDSSPFYPAAFAFDNIITVGAINDDNTRWEDSNYGETAVDIFAPGENIYSATIDRKGGKTYSYESGTSFAAPYVTGVAAMLLSIDPSLSASEIKELILNNADKVDSLDGLCVTGGKLNALNAVGSLVFEFDNGEIIGVKEGVELSENIILPNAINGVEVTSIGANAFVNEQIKSITIPSSVSSISDTAFSGCAQLQSVIFEDGSLLESFGTAFSCMGNLKSINFGVDNELINIEVSAFEGCSSLVSIEIPGGVTSIGTAAFKGCSSLQEINMPSGLSIINDSTFEGCSSLTSIEIPGGVTSIGGSAFKGCSSLQEINIPSGLSIINDSTFEGCSSLTSIEIPGDATIIGVAAFKGCSGLREINIQSGVMLLGISSFEDCSSLSEVSLPSSVVHINSSAFKGCSGLSSIEFSNELINLGASTFQDCINLTRIIIPYNIKEIYYSTFEGCSSLTSIEIPGGVTSIGGSAFKGCSSLQEINIPSGISTINDSAFEDCVSLTSVTIPDNVTEIGALAFEGCAGLTSIEIPDNVTTIGNSAFGNCDMITSITVPSGVTNIGIGAFGGCASLESLTIPFIGGKSEGEEWTSLSYIFGNAGGSSVPSSLKTVTINGNITEVPEDAFKNCSSIQTINLPDSITRIGEYAFYGCSSMSDIELPSGVTTIGVYAFAECHFVEFVIPESVTIIGATAFNNCIYLQEITIPESVTEIGDEVFCGCDSLMEIELKRTVDMGITEIGSGAFYCPNLGIITVGDKESETAYKNSVNTEAPSVAARIWYATPRLVYTSNESNTGYVVAKGNADTDGVVVIPPMYCGLSVTEIAENAFENCTSMTEIVMPESITIIGDYAFKNTTSMYEIEIPSCITYMGEYVFYGWTSDNVIIIMASVDILENWDANWASSCYAVIEWDGYEIHGSYGLYYELTDGTYEVSVGTSIQHSRGTTIIIPAMYNGLPVTRVADYGFMGCGTITKIMVVGNSLTAIGESAFSGCSSLENINLPDGITSIGENAFNGCDNLYSLTMPMSLVQIAHTTFDNIPAGYTIYTELFSGAAEWHFTNSATNYSIFWQCELSEDKSYVISVTHLDDNIYNTDPLYEPYREGYIFEGWSEMPGGSTAEYSMTDIKENAVEIGTVLYAVWA